MSWEATAYVKRLRECPDGAPITVEQKLLLFCLADAHNRDKRMCWPSMPALAEDALLSLRTVQRCMDYLARHLVIEIHRPENQGRGKLSWYSFLELDNPAKLKVCLHQLAKGCQPDTLFSAPERVTEGCQKQPERVTEGCQATHRNKEEPGTNRNQEPRARPRADVPSFPQAPGSDFRDRTTAELEFIVLYWERNGMGKPAQVIAEISRRKGIN